MATGDLVGIFDADQEYSASDLKRLVDCIRNEDIDYVCGSRFIGNKERINVGGNGHSIKNDIDNVKDELSNLDKTNDDDDKRFFPCSSGNFKYLSSASNALARGFRKYGSLRKAHNQPYQSPLSRDGRNVHKPRKNPKKLRNRRPRPLERLLSE